VALGGGLGVLATARTWSSVTVRRLAPLASIHHDVAGRTLQPAVTGLAVVALAGVLALLATRGFVRRLVGGVLVLAGIGMVWWSLAGLTAVSDARGRTLVADARSGLDLGAASGTDVTVHPAWIVIAALGGVLVVLSGAATAVRGGRWRAMSARYESPAAPDRARVPLATAGDATDSRPFSAVEPLSDQGPLGAVDPHDPPDPVDPLDPDAAEVSRARAHVALWQQLDRGEDPTADR
jgi:uncharacterized membrane protein (TIGR02234 family)